jgi:histidyl-tRNA synthetase
MKKETVKGFRDYLGEDAEKRDEMKKIIVDLFERYGFKPAETPIVEYEKFVKGENTGDEAISDIFKLKDKGKRKLALRYEFTFQLKRLMKNQKLPFKRYQIGSVFRDEPVSANRLRQFTQCDVDTIGSTIKDEAEILSLAGDILNNLGIEPVILINNRKLMNEVLEDFGIKKKDRLNVLREIDKYDKLPEKQVKNNLKKYKADGILASLKKGEKFFSQFPSYKEIISLVEYCKAYGVRVLFSPTMVRGLGYYNGSVFEVKAKGIRETIVAGGSYMFNSTQCTGISFGLDRLMALAEIDFKKERYLVVSLDEDREAIKLAGRLRNLGNIVSVFYGKPSKALGYANSYGIQNVIFVGSKEVKSRKFKLKDMRTGKEKRLPFKL